LKVVPVPTEPTRFDVAGNTAAIADECPVDEMTVIDCECRTDQAAEIDVAPRL
jgi:hypothetical protein